MIRFHNTLSGRDEEFTPLVPGQVKLYTCGPTVYADPHIGNMRAYVFEDLLKRFLRLAGFQVLHIMNITDVEDKIIRDAKAAGLDLPAFTARFIESFFRDLKTLRVDPADRYPRATEHIPEMVALIRGLLDKGVAYRKDGSIYFDISKFPAYGRLSKMRREDLRPTARVGARLDADEYEKDNAQDFALWKAVKPGEPSWETELGPGRPGWHIECSAMSSKYLGETFDIHCGGMDNIFPHHENEIAQSEAFSGRPFVRYWMHCHLLLRDGEKMSKSKGNSITLGEILARGADPAAVRFLLLSTHYRKILNFTEDALDAARSGLQRIRDFLAEIESRALPPGGTTEAAALVRETRERFKSGLGDDLNISLALTALYELIHKGHILLKEERLRADDASEMASLVYSLDDAVLAVLPPRGGGPLPEALRALIEARDAARRDRDFARADALRGELLKAGVVIEDTKDGVRWKIVKPGGAS